MTRAETDPETEDDAPRARARPVSRWGVAAIVRIRRGAEKLGLGRLPGIFAGIAMVMAPTLFAGLIFAAGVVILWSLAMPVVPDRLEGAADLLQVAAVNTSHFFGSLAGVLLLLVAAGLRRRSRSAWGIALVLLLGLSVLEISRGGAWSGSFLLLGLAAALYVSRGAFYRIGGLQAALAERGWIAMSLLAFATFVWLGFIVFEDTPYSDDLWWQFVLEGGGVSRFLRAVAGGAVLLSIVVIWRLTAPAPFKTTPPALDEAELFSALAAGNAGHADANLAWLGDKHLFWSESGETFLQYGVRGRRFIVMGEPYGRREEISGLLRAFRDHADRLGMSLSFYSTGRELLPELVELGLIVQKIGESAIIPLADFSLEGHHRKPLRATRRRAERDGLSFRVVPKEDVPEILPGLAPISDEWLGKHEGEEKTFSLGRFDPDYLKRFPMAVIEKDGVPVAFANIWTTAGKREVSIDLMRYGDAAPNGTMDYLFIELALWGQAEGYGVLDLGMAPLSGLEEDRLAPLLSQVGAFAYEHGGRFYGFQGLRSYKAKFSPEWEPLYLAAPTRLSLPFALADVALLTSGGVRGMIRRN